MVKKFGIDKLKPKRALVASHTKIPRDDSREKVDESMYRNIIGSLLYLTAKKPDIAFVVEVCDHYQFDPRASYIHYDKRIFKYILGTLEYGLWYPFDLPQCLLVTVMQIGQGVLRTTRVLWVVDFLFWAIILLHGLARNKIVYLSL